MSHGVTASDQPSYRVPRRAVSAVPIRLISPDALELGQEHVRPERLRDVVIRATLHGRDSRIYGSVRRHEDNVSTRPALLDMLQEGKSVRSRQLQISYHDVHRVGFHQAHRSLGLSRVEDGVTRFGQVQMQRDAFKRLVINDEDASF